MRLSSARTVFAGIDFVAWALPCGEKHDKGTEAGLDPELKTRTSLFQCALPVRKSPTPGNVQLCALTLFFSTGERSSGSFVTLSPTDAHADTFPVAHVPS